MKDVVSTNAVGEDADSESAGQSCDVKDVASKNVVGEDAISESACV